MVVPQITRLADKGRFVIPKGMRDDLKLETGSEVIICQVDDGLFIKRFDENVFEKVLCEFKNQIRLNRFQ